MKKDEPFRFFSRQSLTFATGLKARSLRQLFDGIRTVSDGVIYQHTHAFLRDHHYLVPEPSNDFAYWVTDIIGDSLLGEQLASIDIVRFHSLENLRLELLKAWESGAEITEPDRMVPEGESFYFLDVQRFSLATPYEARTLEEFSRGLRNVGTSSLYLHVFEARLRPPLGRNDFSLWLEQNLGEKELAHSIETLDPYSHTLEGLRASILRLVEGRVRS